MPILNWCKFIHAHFLYASATNQICQLEYYQTLSNKEKEGNRIVTNQKEKVRNEKRWGKDYVPSRQVPTTLPFFSMFYLNFGNKIALLVPNRNKSKACHKRLEGRLKRRKGVYVQRWWNLQENVLHFFPWGLSYGILNECKGPKEKDDWTWHRENNFSENWGKKLRPCSMIMSIRGS